LDGSAASGALQIEAFSAFWTSSFVLADHASSGWLRHFGDDGGFSKARMRLSV
jgi:hypothetical protein